jgi:hypothetical protein
MHTSISKGRGRGNRSRGRHEKHHSQMGERSKQPQKYYQNSTKGGEAKNSISQTGLTCQRSSDFIARNLVTKKVNPEISK